MLHAINILGIFEDISQTRWNNCDIREFIVTFKKNVIPAFIFTINSDKDVVTAQLFDSNNVLICDLVNISATTDGTTSTIVHTGGLTPEDVENTYCYIKITIDAKDYFTEMFYVSDCVSKLFGIKVVSSDLTLNGNTLLPFSLLDEIEFYLPVNGVSISTNEASEEGVEKYYADVPTFASVSILRKAEINGTIQIFKMLSYLRSLVVNGEVSVIYGGYESRIITPLTETKDENAFGDTIIITFSYKEFDFVASRNEI